MKLRVDHVGRIRITNWEVGFVGFLKVPRLRLDLDKKLSNFREKTKGLIVGERKQMIEPSL